MKNRINLKEGKTVESLAGVFRTTLAFNKQTMMCHFYLKKGAVIPIHHHEAVQNGYVIKGKIKFLKENEGECFTAEPGSSYLFDANEVHGAEILEDSEVLDCFSPMRPDYVP